MPPGARRRCGAPKHLAKKSSADGDSELWLPPEDAKQNQLRKVKQTSTKLHSNSGPMDFFNFGGSGNGSPGGVIELASSGSRVTFAARAPPLRRPSESPVASISGCGFYPKAEAPLFKRGVVGSSRLAGGLRARIGAGTSQPTAGASPRVPGPHWHL